MSDRAGFSPCVHTRRAPSESPRRRIGRQRTAARQRFRQLVLEVLEIRACPTASVSLTAGSLNITEGGTQMVMVQAMGSFTGEIIVNYGTNPGTATSGTDYTPRTGSVTLTP